MSRDLRDIVAEVLDLPLAARAEVAGELLDSLDELSEEENDQLWAAEAERRFADYKAGKIEAIPVIVAVAHHRRRPGYWQGRLALGR